MIIILLPSSAFSWSSFEHKIIVQIAYDHLTPKTKLIVNHLTKVLDRKYTATPRLYYAAIWPDLLISQDDVTAFRYWHFIDYPYSNDGTKTQPFLRKNNVVWAIGQAQHVLISSKATTIEKSLALRFLLHLVGDAHQPLHCISRFSKKLPNGDGGGNLFPINSKNATNLHSLWDHAVGSYDYYFEHHHTSISTIKSLAHQLEVRYPPKYFAHKTEDLNPEHWTIESYNIAKNFTYKNIQENSKPTIKYLAAGRKIAAKRLALAGYRLANLLNSTPFVFKHIHNRL